MTKAERLLFIVNMFRVRRRITLEELARECEVSKRTIYRDLLSLSSLNIPIYYNDGYHLARDISLPPLNFTLDEQELLGFSLKNSSLARSPHLTSKLRNIELKILSALPEKRKDRLGCLLQNSKRGVGRFSDDEDAIIRNFLGGLFDKKEMDVTLAREGRVLRGLRAHSLQIKGRSWILCFVGDQESRTFNIAVDKIAGIKVHRVGKSYRSVSQ